MALARARRGGDGGVNYWPGFVDALSTLILGIVFMLTVFVVVQFYLSQEVTGKDEALQRLNAQIAQLTDLLSLEKTDKSGLADLISQLKGSLAAAEGERDRDQREAGIDRGHVLQRWQDERAGTLARRFLRHAQTAVSLPQMEETVVALA